MDNSSSIFRFKQFAVRNSQSALKVGTDAVLLGAAMSISDNAKRALDIGTGTGVIALMAAQRSSSMQIDAIDIDEASAAEASYNFSRSPWASRLYAHQLSLQTYAKNSAQFDLIFSNPPFYDNSLLNPSSREAAARHEESLSLSEICAFASKYLHPDGSISLILPADRQTAFLRSAASFGLFPFRILSIKTTPTKPAKRVIIELSLQKRPLLEESIILMQAGERSEEYKQLTKEFYL